MSDENQAASLLLAIIPSFLLRPEQVAHWSKGGGSPTCKLLREQVNLNELNGYTHGIAIWRENGTLTYVTPHGIDDYPTDKRLSLSLLFGDKGPSLEIYGSTEDAISETAAFFMHFEKRTAEISTISIGSSNYVFDFTAAPSQCFTRLFDVSPSCHVKLQGLNVSAAQSTVLASRLHPVSLTFYGCDFEDDGTAFVDALESRPLPLGSLTFDDEVTLSDVNLKRLLQADVGQHLRLPFLERSDEIGLLPLSAKVDSLDYFFYTPLLMADLKGLNIVAKKIWLSMDQFDAEHFPAEPVLSLFRRLAEFSHFEEMRFRFNFMEIDQEIPDCVVQELIRAALANSSLRVLDLSTNDEDVKWDLHFATLFEGLKVHKALRILRITADNDIQAFGLDFIRLRQFLCRHRNITVTNADGEIYTDGFWIDEIYSINRFYRGSKRLMIEPPPERSMLVATAMMETASSCFQRSALLLANHADALNEIIQFAQFDDEVDAGEFSSQSDQRQKRRRRM